MIRDYWREIRNYNFNSIDKENLEKLIEKNTYENIKIELAYRKAYKDIYDIYLKIEEELLKNGKITGSYNELLNGYSFHNKKFHNDTYMRMITDELIVRSIEKFSKILKVIFSHNNEIHTQIFNLLREISISENLCGDFKNLCSAYKYISQYVSDILIDEENLNTANLLMLMFCFKNDYFNSVLAKIYNDEKDFYEYYEEGYENTINGKYKDLILSSIKKVVPDDSDKNMHYILSLFTKRIQLLLQKIDSFKEIYPNLSYGEITDITVYTDILHNRDSYKYYLDLFNNIDEEKKKNLFRLIVPMEYDIKLFPEYEKYEDDFFFSSILYNQLFKNLSYNTNLNKDLEREKDKMFIKKSYGTWIIPEALGEIYSDYELEASKFNLKHHEHIPKNIEVLYVFNDYFIKDEDFISKVIEKENSNEIIKNITKIKDYIYSHLPHNIDQKQIKVEAYRYIIEYIDEEIDEETKKSKIFSSTFDINQVSTVSKEINHNLEIDIKTFDTCELQAIKLIFNILKKMIIEDNIEYLDALSQIIKQVYDEPVDDYLLYIIKACISNKKENKKSYTLKP